MAPVASAVRHATRAPVDRPHLARRPHRPALAVLRVAGTEVGAGHPRAEVVLRAPARQHEAVVAVVVGPQQLEALEALRARHLAGAHREALRELLEALSRDGDGVDLDDGHG